VLPSFDRDNAAVFRSAAFEFFAADSRRATGSDPVAGVANWTIQEMP